MTNYDVVKKLIGPINPVGETNEDNRRYLNLEAMIELTDKLLFNIGVVTQRCSDPRASVQKAAKRASEFYDDLGIPE